MVQWKSACRIFDDFSPTLSTWAFVALAVHENMELFMMHKLVNRDLNPTAELLEPTKTQLQGHKDKLQVQ